MNQGYSDEPHESKIIRFDISINKRIYRCERNAWIKDIDTDAKRCLNYMYSDATNPWQGYIDATNPWIEDEPIRQIHESRIYGPDDSMNKDIPIRHIHDKNLPWIKDVPMRKDAWIRSIYAKHAWIKDIPIRYFHESWIYQCDKFMNQGYSDETDKTMNQG